MDEALEKAHDVTLLSETVAHRSWFQKTDPSLVSQRFYRIEPGRTVSRINTGGHADQGRGSYRDGE